MYNFDKRKLLWEKLLLLQIKKAELGKQQLV